MLESCCLEEKICESQVILALFLIEKIKFDPIVTGLCLSFLFVTLCAPTDILHFHFKPCAGNFVLCEIRFPPENKCMFVFK